MGGISCFTQGITNKFENFQNKKKNYKYIFFFFFCFLHKEMGAAHIGIQISDRIGKKFFFFFFFLKFLFLTLQHSSLVGMWICFDKRLERPRCNSAFLSTRQI